MPDVTTPHDGWFAAPTEAKPELGYATFSANVDLLAKHASAEPLSAKLTPLIMRLGAQ